ncbi:hypothetical protein [uncultured Sphingomonas sp.]|uniref:hypothetical protein n=1 Tax=uncultured Sphingomonas sp. TaxID=158754 RepID=UPI00260C609F|nr:hypothetical protein [uncultured Sphingomonas sp.]
MVRDEPLTRNDILFVRVSKEIRALRDTLDRAQRMLGFIEASTRMFLTQTNRKPCVYLPVDFTRENDPYLMAFEPAFQLFEANYDALVAYVARLEKSIETKKALIDAYHNGEDILLARLSAQ